MNKIIVCVHASECVCVFAQSFSCVQLLAIPWTVAHQSPPSVGFSRQEYWSGLTFPSLGDIQNLPAMQETLV